MQSFVVVNPLRMWNDPSLAWIPSRQVWEAGCS
jgi:hypothetical protein